MGSYSAPRLHEIAGTLAMAECREDVGAFLEAAEVAFNKPLRDDFMMGKEDKDLRSVLLLAYRKLRRARGPRSPFPWFLLVFLSLSSFFCRFSWVFIIFLSFSEFFLGFPCV